MVNLNMVFTGVCYTSEKVFSGKGMLGSLVDYQYWQHWAIDCKIGRVEYSASAEMIY